MKPAGWLLRQFGVLLFRDQVLTDEDKQRLQNLGSNGDKIDPKAWGTWTSSVTNYQAKAEEVLNGMKGVKVPAAPQPRAPSLSAAMERIPEPQPTSRIRGSFIGGSMP